MTFRSICTEFSRDAELGDALYGVLLWYGYAPNCVDIKYILYTKRLSAFFRRLLCGIRIIYLDTSGIYYIFAHFYGYLPYDHKKNCNNLPRILYYKNMANIGFYFLFHLIWKNYVLCLDFDFKKSQIVDFFTHFNHWKKCHKQFFSSKYQRRKIIISTYYWNILLYTGLNT